MENFPVFVVVQKQFLCWMKLGAVKLSVLKWLNVNGVWLHLLAKVQKKLNVVQNLWIFQALPLKHMHLQLKKSKFCLLRKQHKHFYVVHAKVLPQQAHRERLQSRFANNVLSLCVAESLKKQLKILPKQVRCVSAQQVKKHRLIKIY